MHIIKKCGGVLLGLTLILLPFQATIDLNAQSSGKGNIVGFIYQSDGTTPLEGAVIKVKNIGSGSLFESTRSDEHGTFKIEGVEKGVYVYGVSTPEGDFNSDTFMGVRIKENETAKVSIAVDPYKQDISASMKEVYAEQKASGESLIGRVIESNDGGLTDVYIIKGYLEKNQRIHAKGESTNFYQDVKELKSEGAPAKRLYAGETATIKMRNKTQPGDFVYLVCKKGILPMFLAPLGVAAIIGGSAAIVTDNEPNDEDPDAVSPFK